MIHAIFYTTLQYHNNIATLQYHNNIATLQYHNNIWRKMLENRPDDALGSLVETVETVETV